MVTRTRGSERATAEAERVQDLLNSLGSTTCRQLRWQRASELDLTYAQAQVLFYVAEHPGAHMGDVAKAFGVTLPAVTHIVDRLEQKAFLVRGDHPADRRIYMLDLTRAGKTLVEERQAMRLRGIEGVLARMSFHDRPRAAAGLEALVDAASSESDGTAKPARSRRAK